jgi:predicted amidohydrolase
METELDSHYDKRHLFTIGEEDSHYAQGNTRNVIQYHDWKLMPMICYDLRFPVWSRNNLNYDVLFYSANWPASRNDVWETLLKARAIENQAYVIGVNRIGIDGLNISYIGNSQIISPKGKIMVSLTNEEDFLYAELDKEKLTEFRDKFPVLKDRDNFEIV